RASASRMTRRTALVVALGAVAGAAALAGCAADEPAPDDTTAAAEPTCETLITPGLADDLAELGGEALEEPFVIGGDTLDDGIQCKWGDPSGGSDTMQLYAWAPVDAEQSEKLQSSLADDGWIREEDDSRVLLTEDPETAFQTDEDGFGFTYAFGDGWVTFSDTRAGLDVIRWPR